MKFFNLFIAVLLLSLSVFADSLDCEGDDCQVQTCNVDIDTEYYCAISSEIGSYCNNYVVVMETKANAKVLVKAKIVDYCKSCTTYHVSLSRKAYTTLTEDSEGRSDIIWGIYSESGNLVKGPFYNNVDAIAESYNLSNNSFIAAFKVLAGRIAANNSSYGTFNVTRGKNTFIKKTSTDAAQPTTAPEETNNNDNQNTNNEESIEVPISQVQSQEGEVDMDTKNLEFDGESPDTITYGTDAGSDFGSPKSNNANYDETIVLNQPSTEGENVAQANLVEGDDSSSSGAALSVLAISCIGAGGAGLLLLKKKNPTKYDELKKKFPEAFNSVKRRASSIGRSKKSNENQSVTLPTTNNYMQTTTIEEDEIPRIPVYDNQDPLHRN
ncbi:hypothetical protein BCR36DRAFT_585237 [Piromyces finnis]|uniref:RlpA-like protein double-psi beta-barrel domain-containing protein n=1 Tax=Piromyces finnis TaxID=1754191 RepID=A0A1Y1V3H3_9FUNG|nr:hypothetical protein BCR36DRAFT_585237 [Piromyces finnis]|eukprot:ORX46418.1 hypothetical protein BCR36DRAFT_585237 [Piromyces finnis]